MKKEERNNLRASLRRAASIPKPRRRRRRCLASGASPWASGRGSPKPAVASCLHQRVSEALQIQADPLQLQIQVEQKEWGVVTHLKGTHARTHVGVLTARWSPRHAGVRTGRRSSRWPHACATPGSRTVVGALGGLMLAPCRRPGQSLVTTATSCPRRSGGCRMYLGRSGEIERRSGGEIGVSRGISERERRDVRHAPRWPKLTTMDKYFGSVRAHFQKILEKFLDSFVTSKL